MPILRRERILIRRTPYRAGIVGCGRIGCAFDDDPHRGYVSTHAGAYTRTEGVELVALCDLDETRVNRYGSKFGVPGRYTDYVEMLENENLDILSICTADSTHLELVRAATERGIKAIFCEKPIAESLAAADEMIRLCADKNVLLMVDHQRRFDPLHQQLARFLGDGGIGRIQQVTCYYTAGAANTGSHLFDLLNFYVGNVNWVQGRLSANLSPNASDPNIDGWLNFADGSIAAVQACDVKAYLIFEIAILGTAGRLRVTSSGFSASYETAQDSKRFAGYKELADAPPPVSLEGPREFMLFGVTHLLECLNTGQKPISSGEDGRAALEVICALQRSANNGNERVHLPLVET